MGRSEVLNYALLVLVAFIWSTSFAAIKLGVAQISAEALAAGRIVIAAVLLNIWLRWVRGEKLALSPTALMQYTLVGVLGNTLPFILIGLGEKIISSALASVLMGIMPIVTFVLAGLFIADERFTRTRLVGVLVGFVGLLVLVGGAALRQLGDEVMAQLLVLGGAVSYAVNTIYVRRQVVTSGMQMAAGSLAMAALFAVLIVLLQERPQLGSWSMQTWAVVGYLGIFPTALASLLYFHLIRALGATTFSQVNYLIPLMGSAIGVWWLGEAFHWQGGVALGLILAGLVLVRRR